MPSYWHTKPKPPPTKEQLERAQELARIRSMKAKPLRRGNESAPQKKAAEKPGPAKPAADQPPRVRVYTPRTAGLINKAQQELPLPPPPKPETSPQPGPKAQPPQNQATKKKAAKKTTKKTAAKKKTTTKKPRAAGKFAGKILASHPETEQALRRFVTENGGQAPNYMDSIKFGNRNIPIGRLISAFTKGNISELPSPIKEYIHYRHMIGLAAPIDGPATRAILKKNITARELFNALAGVIKDRGILPDLRYKNLVNVHHEKVVSGYLTEHLGFALQRGAISGLEDFGFTDEDKPVLINDFLIATGLAREGDHGWLVPTEAALKGEVSYPEPGGSATG